MFPLPTEADMKACKWMQASASCVLLEELSNRPCTGKGHFLVQEEITKPVLFFHPDARTPTRTQQLANVATGTQEAPFDVLIIGGGATGSGIAVDAATRYPLDFGRPWKQLLSVGRSARKSFVVLSSQPCQQEALLHACTCCQVDPVEEAMRAQYRLPQ